MRGSAVYIPLINRKCVTEIRLLQQNHVMLITC